MIFKQVLTISAFLFGMAFQGHWKADNTNAKVGFTVEGIFGTVHGSFSGLQSVIQFNEKDLAASSVSASVDAKSVITGIGLRNSDLRNKEQWFNTDKYPRISFRSKKFEKAESGYKVIGELTIKDITRPIEFPFNFTSKGSTGIFTAQFIIKRLDYHLGKPGGSVGSEVTVQLSIPVNE